MRTVGLFLLVLPVFAATSKYCQGNFAVNTSNCAKFDFGQLKATGQCTDSKKATEGEFHGLALTNCTTQVFFFN